MGFHTHQILIIQNEDKLLQYYDISWESYLFINKKPDTVPYMLDINNYINKQFNVTDTECKYLGELVSKKLSIKDNKIKNYQHFFYLVSSEELNKTHTEEEFTINNVSYKWFDKNALKANIRAMEVNSDIINAVIKLLYG